MDTLQLVNIILSSITLILSAFNPIIIAIAYYLQHIKMSNCCGATTELVHTPTNQDFVLKTINNEGSSH